MLALLTIVLALLPQSSPAFRAWNEPIEPFRVAGPLYYVGPKDITSLLVTTPAGHASIDVGLEESAPIVIANIRKLGFRVEDVKIILSTHAHTDHAGGLARLKTLSGARLHVGAADVELLERGGRPVTNWSTTIATRTSSRTSNGPSGPSDPWRPTSSSKDTASPSTSKRAGTGSGSFVDPATLKESVDRAERDFAKALAEQKK